MDFNGFDFNGTVKRTYENLWIILSAIVTVIALAYSEQFQHMFLINLIVLTVFTLAEGVFIARAIEKYQSKTVGSLFIINSLLRTSFFFFFWKFICSLGDSGNGFNCTNCDCTQPICYSNKIRFYYVRHGIIHWSFNNNYFSSHQHLCGDYRWFSALLQWDHIVFTLFNV